ncbi:MAG: hypothetical protein ACE5GE_13130, partial [Phycisphaerae bacterium]
LNRNIGQAVGGLDLGQAKKAAAGVVSKARETLEMGIADPEKLLKKDLKKEFKDAGDSLKNLFGK